MTEVPVADPRSVISAPAAVGRMTAWSGAAVRARSGSAIVSRARSSGCGEGSRPTTVVVVMSVFQSPGPSNTSPGRACARRALDSGGEAVPEAGVQAP